MKPSGNPLPRLKWQHWLATGAVAASLAGDLRAQAPVQEGPAAGEKVKREGGIRKVSEEERAIAENLGRRSAREDIGSGRFYIPRGQHRQWRPIFMRLFSERYPLVHLSEAATGEGIRGWGLESSKSYKEEMEAGVAERFPNGEMQKVEEDARAIYRKFQTAHPDFGEPPLATGPLPSLGDMTRGDADAAKRFLQLMEQHASFPKPDGGKRQVKLDITSGSHGHSIMIQGVLDVIDQVAVIDIAREIVNAGDYGLIHLVFDNETSHGGRDRREGVSYLSLAVLPNPSRIVTKEDPSTPYPAGYRSDGLEIAEKPPTGDVTGEATAEGKRFLDALRKETRFLSVKSTASGTLAHTVEICEVSSPPMQVAILRNAQKVVDTGEFKPVYIEFTDRGHRGADNGFVYRSRLLVKRPPEAPTAAAETVEKPPEDSRNYPPRGQDFLETFAKRADYPDCQIMDYRDSTTLEIYGVADTARQDVLVRIVQKMVSRSTYDSKEGSQVKPVQVDFRDRRHGEASYGAGVLRPREKVLRGQRIVWSDPTLVPDAVISDEIVAMPEIGDRNLRTYQNEQLFFREMSKLVTVKVDSFLAGYNGSALSYAGVAETEEQLEILKIAQEVINRQNTGGRWFYIEFLDNSRPRTVTLPDGQQIQRGTVLRSRLLTKAGQEPLKQEIVEKPVGQVTTDSRLRAHEFRTAMLTRGGFPLYEVQGTDACVSVTFRRIVEPEEQLAIIEKLRRLVILKRVPKLYVEFLSETKEPRVVNGRTEILPKILRSTILTYTKPE